MRRNVIVQAIVFTSLFILATPAYCQSSLSRSLTQPRNYVTPRISSFTNLDYRVIRTNPIPRGPLPLPEHVGTGVSAALVPGSGAISPWIAPAPSAAPLVINCLCCEPENGEKTSQAYDKYECGVRGAQILEASPDSSFAAQTARKAYSDLGEAIRIYEQQVPKPDSYTCKLFVSHYYRAVAAARMENSGRVIEEAKIALGIWDKLDLNTRSKLAPTLPKPVRTLKGLRGLHYALLGRIEALVDCGETVDLIKGNVDPTTKKLSKTDCQQLLEIVSSYRKLGDEGRAIALLTDTIGLTDEITVSVDAYLERGKARLDSVPNATPADINNALVDFTKARDSIIGSPYSFDSDHLWDAERKMAQIYRSLGDYENMIRTLTEFLTLRRSKVYAPDHDMEALYNRAEGYFLESNFAVAINELTTILQSPALNQIDGGRFDCLMLRGKVYLKTQDFDKAIADFKAAVSENPGDKSAQAALAEASSHSQTPTKTEKTSDSTPAPKNTALQTLNDQALIEDAYARIQEIRARNETAKANQELAITHQVEARASAAKAAKPPVNQQAAKDPVADIETQARIYNAQASIDNAAAASVRARLDAKQNQKVIDATK